MKRKKWFWIGAALLVVIAIVLWGNSALTVTKLRVTSEALPEAFDGFRIAQVSDLHNAKFGADNERLLKLLSEAEPDIIVFTGDSIDSSRTDISVVVALAREVVELAPTYFVTGNHEAIAINDFEKLNADLAEVGATVLRTESVQLERNGETIQLIGMDDLGFYAKTRPVSEAMKKLAGDLASLVEPDSFSLVLSHRPELAEFYESSGANLILTGHAHGGQFRLPFVGGVIAPGQGLFPEYDAGLYALGETQMVVSRGLGNSIVPLRINNRPEVVLIELSPK